MAPVLDLVLRAQRGDRGAFTSLVQAIADRMFATADRILNDAGLAQYAVQEALLAAWRQLPQLRDPERFEAWVWRLLVRACYAQSKRRSAWRANEQTLPAEGPPAVDGVAALADREVLDRAFRRLSVEHRAVFVLHHHLGMPLVEIAQLLGIPDGTARSRLHHATRALRAAIESDMAVAVPGGRTA
jgi:RNA polymerase sigma-70 factor (ECF subfamily)